MTNVNAPRRRVQSLNALRLSGLCMMVTLLTSLPRPAGAEGLLDRLLRSLGFGKPGVYGPVLKGADSFKVPALAIWTARSDGTDSHPITEELGYRSPIFAPDGQSIWTVRGREWVQVSRKSGAQQVRIDLGEFAAEASGLLLVGWREVELCAATSTGKVLNIDVDKGAIEHVGTLSARDLESLRIASRRCKDRHIFSGKREQGPGGSTTDRIRLYATRANEQASRAIALQIAIALDPAFSAQCDRIVFVGATHW